MTTKHTFRLAVLLFGALFAWTAQADTYSHGYDFEVNDGSTTETSSGNFTLSVETETFQHSSNWGDDSEVDTSTLGNVRFIDVTANTGEYASAGTVPKAIAIYEHTMEFTNPTKLILSGEAEISLSEYQSNALDWRWGLGRSTVTCWDTEANPDVVIYKSDSTSDEPQVTNGGYKKHDIGETDGNVSNSVVGSETQWLKKDNEYKCEFRVEGQANAGTSGTSAIKVWGQWEMTDSDVDCNADLTEDGVVNINDQNEVILNFGGSGPDGDVDGDGSVDIDDLNIVLVNFGADVCP